jgi:hypothetical protein
VFLLALLTIYLDTAAYLVVVQQPKFALSGPAERSAAASRASGSPSPTRSCSSRGCKSSSPSPFPIRQHSAASLASAAAAASARDGSNPSPYGISPAAAAAAADGNPDGESRSVDGAGAAASGRVALRKGINFGDTQIYEYQCRAPGAGDTGSNSRSGSRTRGSSSRRSSGRSSDGGNLGEGMTRSRSLGSLLSDEKGLLAAASSAASAATAAAVGLRREPSGSGARACKSPGASLSGATSLSSKSLGVVSSSNGSGDGCKSGERTKKSPSRGPSSSNLRMPSAAAAALQQVGLGCGLQAVGGAAGVGTPAGSCMPAPGQLQQQWLAVPQLPRMGGGVHASGAHHKRCKSSSPVLCAAEQQPGSVLLLAPQTMAATAAGGKPR